MKTVQPVLFDTAVSYTRSYHWLFLSQAYTSLVLEKQNFNFFCRASFRIVLRLKEYFLCTYFHVNFFWDECEENFSAF